MFELSTRAGHKVTAISPFRVGGYLIKWTTPETKDSYDTYFPSDMDLLLEAYSPAKVPVFLEHAEGGVRKSLIGHVVAWRKDEYGLYIEAELNPNGATYLPQLKADIEEGLYFWSSGSVGHLVETARDGRMLTWPVIEASLTKTPATILGTDVVALETYYAARGIALDTLRSPHRASIPPSNEQPHNQPSSIEDTILMPEETNQASVTRAPLKLIRPSRARIEFIRTQASAFREIEELIEAITSKYEEEDDTAVMANPVEDLAIDNDMEAALDLISGLVSARFGITKDEARQAFLSDISAMALKAYEGDEEERAEASEDESEEERNTPAVLDEQPRTRGWQSSSNAASRFTAPPRASYRRGANGTPPNQTKRTGIIDSPSQIMRLFLEGRQDIIARHNQGVRAHYEQVQRKEQMRAEADGGSYRAQAIVPSQKGGFVVAPAFAEEMIQLLRDAAVVAGLCRRVPISAYEVRYPKQTAGSRAYFAQENKPVTESDVDLDSVVLRAKRLTTLVPLSLELFNDAFITMDDFIANDITADFAEVIDNTILYGGGVGEQPLGIYNTAGVTKEAIAAPTWPDVVARIKRLQQAKGRGVPSWVFNPASEAYFRTLKDDNDNYLWVGNNAAYNQGAAGGVLESFAGYGVYNTNQATDPANDTKGSVFFATWGEAIYYMQHQAIEIAVDLSGEAFKNYQMIVRGVTRFDVAVAYPEQVQIMENIG